MDQPHNWESAVKNTQKCQIIHLVFLGNYLYKIELIFGNYYYYLIITRLIPNYVFRLWINNFNYI